MVRLVVFDVDGTVLERGENSLSDTSLATIENIAKMGIPIAFASGRCYHELIRLFADLSFEPVYAASDGSLCVAGDEVLVDMPIAKNDVMCLFNSLKSFDCVGVEFCGKYLSYVYAKDKELSNLRKQRENQIKCISSAADIEDDIYKITVYGIKEAAFVRAQLKKTLKDSLRIVYEGDDIFEIVRADADKQVAVEAIKKRCIPDGGKVLAVGDGDNDLPVLKKAELAIAMAHSGKHIKNICIRSIKNICEIEKILIESILEVRK